MAKQYVTDRGTVKIPGAYPYYKIQTSPGGLAANGIIALVGEARGGAHWADEDDLETAVVFGPDSLAEVEAKFQSGPLVDAFRGAIAASSDPEIVGSFNRAVLLKTNSPASGTGKASAAVLTLGSGSAYETVFDRNVGTLGNQIQIGAASAVTEVVPTTGSFTYIPAVSTVNAAVRVNGAASVPLALAANTTPTAFVTAADGLAGIDATGGVNRSVLTASTGTITLAVVSGNAVTVTRSVAWTNLPVIGDTMVIPVGSIIVGASQANAGAYVVTGVSSTVVNATKLSDAGKATPAPVVGTITAPAGATGAVSATPTNDLVVYSPVTITSTASNVIPGVGKSLEIAELTTGLDLLSRTAFNLGTTTAVSWVSKSATPAILTSSAESEMTLTAARAADSKNETFTEGGEIALTVGYTGSDVTLSVTTTQLTTSAGLALDLADFATIQALANYIAAQPGYSAAVGNATLGLLPPTALDVVTAIGMTSHFGTIKPARVKIDAYRMYTAISTSSSLISMDARPAAGLPAVTAATFLSGGAAGLTSNSAIVDALAALEDFDVNFVVPLFSRDATEDIAEGLTDASSTYDIASVHAAAKAHVLAMSTFKARRSRQAVVSHEDTFANQMDAASNLSHYRVADVFQNVKDLDSNGDIITFQPWMAAVKAVSMQSAGFYRAITNKKVTISGLSHAAGDFNPRKDSHLENALTAGLMPLRPARTGGFVWVSDQTTYGADDNFALNSMQAVYAADTVSLTTGQRMEQAFVGQSVADISAQVALTYLDQIMADFLRLKLIAPSDDAKKGYKNAKIRISGNVMLVSVEIKLAGAIDFVIIDFLVSPVQQAA